MSVAGAHAPVTLSSAWNSTDTRSFSNEVSESTCSLSNKRNGFPSRRLRLVSANVGSLHTSHKYGGQQDILNSCSRLSLLEDMFSSSDFDVVGIHEGRFREEQQINGVHFTIHAAKADSGCYGSQIWIKNIFRHEHLATIVSCSRLLAVVIVPDGHKAELGLVAAHGPHSGDLPQKICDFWQLVTEFILGLQTRFPNLNVAMLCDANGRVGSVPSSSIGTFNTEFENYPGQCFRLCIESCHLKAINTFYPGSPTWYHIDGNGHRIDYVCLCESLFTKCDSARTHVELDIAPSTRVDHFAVSADTDLLLIDENAPQPLQAKEPRRKKFSINMSNIDDPYRCQQFQNRLWGYMDYPQCSIDEQLENFIEFTKSEASQIFGVPPKRPKQPWMGQRTFRVARWSGRLRRIQCSTFGIVRNRCLLGVAFHTWCAMFPAPFVYGTDNTSVDTRISRGWLAIVRRDEIHLMLSFLWSLEAVAFSSLYWVKRIVSILSVNDKQIFYDDVAFKAARCAERGDFACTFKLVRALGKFTVKPIRAVKNCDGSVTKTARERELRWQEYFTELYGGVIKSSVREAVSVSLAPVVGDLPISVLTTFEFIQKLGENKACGPDELHAKLLKAGGLPLAVAINRVEVRSVKEETVPVQWKGGRLVDLYKKKGDASECCNSRGLLVSDHLAQAYIGKLRDSAKDELRSTVPEDQFGGCSGGGTDYPTLVVKQLIAFSVKASQSIFLLFLDLVAAYDSVIREVAMGIPHNIEHSQRLDYLTGIGLPKHAAEHVIEYLEANGCVFEQAQMNPKTIRLMNALHTRAWAAYGSLDSIVVSSKGGRQGCKMGGIIFGAIFGVAIKEVRRRFNSLGVSVHVKFPTTRPFWFFDPETDPYEARNVVEVTFVDDTCIVIICNSATLLVSSVHELLSIIIDVFTRFSLRINFSKGKTECLLQLRGRRSTEVRESLRRNGALQFALPAPYENDVLRVVDHYKHLGSVVCLSESLIYDAQHRCSAALCSYTAMSGRVFGSICIPTRLKIHLLISLVLSRLLYGTQHWCGSMVAAMRKLNAVYMRGLRKIIGDCKFGKCKFTDFRVREQLQQPSIDCLLLRRRLAFLGRIVITSHKTVVAVLAMRARNCLLPWVEQINADMLEMWKLWPDGRKHLPHPAEHAMEWWHFMLNNAERWKRLVAEVFFVHSILDERAEASMADPLFACTLCEGSNFSSNQALLQHMRTKHDQKLRVSAYIDGSGRCPTCLTFFNTRLRVLKHLSDSRRTKCTTNILNGSHPLLDRAERDRLDEADRVQKRLARRNGHTSVPAVGPAQRANGKRVGRVQL